MDFKAHRQQIFARMPDNSIALLSAGALQYRNNDTERPYRQCSYFFYVTGFEEHDAFAVLIKKGNENRFVLFCQERDLSKEQWTGPMIGPEGAIKYYGADEAFDICELDSQMPNLLQDKTSAYFLFNDLALSQPLFTWMEELRARVRQGVNPPQQLLDLRSIIDECRLLKTPDEIQILKKAGEITAMGHHEAMRRCKPGMTENDLEAILLYEFCRQGARHCAYPCIVAGGDNANVLHYTRNLDKLDPKDLVLIDAGAEYNNYASDITRTFPVSGRFSKEQQAIYELVLASQLAAIEQIKPGVAWNEMQRTILQVLVQGLVDLKILRGQVNDLIAEKAYFPFYMHNSGHWMGLDVHDVGEYRTQGNWRALEPGMVFTVEPGLYLSANQIDIPESYRGIGVRIEDDILVTQHGAELLCDIVKSVSDIEHLMQQGSARA